MRERREDISLLATRLLGNLAERYRRADLRLSAAAMRVLESHSWPGNVRQLFSALEYAVVQSDGPVILPRHLPRELRRAESSSRAETEDPGEQPEQRGHGRLGSRYYRGSADPADERAAIRRVLAEAGGNRAEAARRLGMSRTTLWKRLREGA
jgi:Response regulator containing CheY-like receiver, AAA-type ATPase, and DNA-binding domains